MQAHNLTSEAKISLETMSKYIVCFLNIELLFIFMHLNFLSRKPSKFQ